MSSNLKVSRSKMHEFLTIAFFKGAGEPRRQADFWYQESKWLFGAEIVVANLVEYEGSQDQLVKRVEGGALNSMVEQLTTSPAKLTIFDVGVDESLVQEDLQIEFSKGSVTRSMPDAIESILAEFGFRFALKIVDHQSQLSQLPMFQEPNFFKIRVSAEFLKSGSTQLHDRLKYAFAEDRYVTTQIPFFMMSAACSGVAKGASKVNQSC